MLAYVKNQMTRYNMIVYMYDKVTKEYQKAITREEFCELVVKLYEKLTGEKGSGKSFFGNMKESDIF